MSPYSCDFTVTHCTLCTVALNSRDQLGTLWLPDFIHLHYTPYNKLYQRIRTELHW